MISIRRLAFAAVLSAFTAAGCASGPSNTQIPSGNGSATSTPSAGLNRPAGIFPITLSFAIPSKKLPAKNMRGPQFISSSTQSVTVAVDGASPVTASQNCTSSPCSVTVDAALGTHLLAVRLWDATGGSGNELASNTAASCTVAATSVNTCPITLYGYPASFLITSSSSNVSGSQTNGFSFLNGTSTLFTIFVLDADGNPITGIGAINPSVTPPNGSVTVATPGPTSTPGAFAIADTSTSTANLSISATPAANSDGSAINASVALTGASIFSNALYYFNSSMLYTVSAATGVQTASFATTQNGEPYVAATQGFALVNGANSSTLYIYNLASQTLAHTVTASCTSNDNIPLAADNGLFYYECGGTVYEYNTSGTLVTSWSDGETDGSTGIVAAGGGFVYTIVGTSLSVWTPSGTLARTVTVAGNPGSWGIAGGQTGVFISTGGKTYEYSPSSGGLLATISTGTPGCNTQPIGTNVLTVHTGGASFATYNVSTTQKTGMFSVSVSPQDCRVGYAND